MRDSVNESVAVHARSLAKYYHNHKSRAARILDFANFLVRGRRSLRFFKTTYVLRNINLDLKVGTTFGILGQNGSGKSTLLKVIAGILSANDGDLKVNGRVASIIELGAGFNPEDTGLENIRSYLTIYGIPGNLFAGKIEQIITFSGLGAKIRDSVKTYSSGMTVRLAFAIIAHLDADILLVDEALAVGDAVFAQKCMRFIKEFKARGTILLVSHDLNTLQNLCDEAIWLHEGEIKAYGNAKSVCEQYLEFTLAEDYPELPADKLSSTAISSDLVCQHRVEVAVAQASPELPSSSFQIDDRTDLQNGFGGHSIQILDVAVQSEDGGKRRLFSDGENMTLSVLVRALKQVQEPIVGFLVKNSRGVEIFGENTLHVSEYNRFHFAEDRTYRVAFRFKLPVLPSGDYTISVAVAEGDFHVHQQLIWRHDVLVIRVSSERFRYGFVGLDNSDIEIKEVIH
ncbi:MULTISPECIES: Wzt carbohydrate-binding domain-containing protein [unclassified Bradyrhizobium]|uniref:ABC transporter ATP-binding protein n=1 Tax=unclassified Bradyrhizobium TaxID=2631580 RepID=UPI001FF8B481|nr:MULTISPECIES: Wzt carbohydrate-binding domain-containing protein [unclassified Bradyrhizobium]MCK1534627.1 ABC transporter ATP-binding protein [Bradyrhizobium sp. 176]MCK1557864.1 ABC transporter ATP-binding protein [Bradyrhizobium sp. 171]UPJ98285.1 ABC transporter ATP-binding protein [Bradyrhizobium sp. 172]